ncbi:iron ABC transporter permease [Streptomyces sp. NPDC050095]|uniref:FecCD family ABC transporter permease n=1 Tax=unclassified Streptomyces TaxID=2593676 RepID=UPI0034360BF2
MTLRPPAGTRALRTGPYAVLVRPRSALIVLALLAALAGAAVLALCAGDAYVPPGRVLDALLTGGGPDRVVVGELRLPRVVLGALVGAALGCAGALIQAVARNPLAGPDVLGVTHGSSVLVVGLMTYGITASPGQLPWAAVAGGLAAGALVYVLAWRGGLAAHRFVLVGIALSSGLSAVTSLFLSHGEGTTAQTAKVWMTGSLNGADLAQARWLGAVLVVALPFLVGAARAMRRLALGDEQAQALGARPGRDRLLLALLGVVLAACAAGAAGPVDFVALVAPQIAVRLTRSPELPLACSALTGAVITVVADTAARTALAPTELPVGVVTALVGAPYLLWLLVRARRTRSH